MEAMYAMIDRFGAPETRNQQVRYFVGFRKSYYMVQVMSYNLACYQFFQDWIISFFRFLHNDGEQ